MVAGRKQRSDAPYRTKPLELCYRSRQDSECGVQRAIGMLLFDFGNFLQVWLSMVHACTAQAERVQRLQARRGEWSTVPLLGRTGQKRMKLCTREAWWETGGGDLLKIGRDSSVYSVAWLLRLLCARIHGVWRRQCGLRGLVVRSLVCEGCNDTCPRRCRQHEQCAASGSMISNEAGASATSLTTCLSLGQPRPLPRKLALRIQI